MILTMTIHVMMMKTMISENDPKPFLTDWKQPEHGFTALGFSSNWWRSSNFRVSREILQEKHLDFFMEFHIFWRSSIRVSGEII